MYDFGMENKPYVTAKDEMSQPGLPGLMYRMLHGMNEAPEALGDGVDHLAGNTDMAKGGFVPEMAQLFADMY